MKVRTLARHNRPPGANSIKFTGRFRGKALKPGRYRAVDRGDRRRQAESKVSRRVPIVR